MHMNLRDEVLTMKRIVVSLVALLLGIVPAKSQIVPGQPAPAASNTVQRAMKLTLKHPWKDSTIPLLIPASPHAPGRIENLKARRATYEITPEPAQRPDPSLLTVLGNSELAVCVRCCRGSLCWEDLHHPGELCRGCLCVPTLWDTITYDGNRCPARWTPSLDGKRLRDGGFLREAGSSHPPIRDEM